MAVPTVTIQKSIFGLLWVLIRGFFFVLLLAGLATWLYPVIGSPWAIVLGLLAVVLFIGTIINAFVYVQCYLSYDDVHLVVYDQLALFGATTNQCDFKDIEDITANRGGIFAYVFNFGTLRVQTAGTRPNFDFTWCPNPEAVRVALIALANTD